MDSAFNCVYDFLSLSVCLPVFCPCFKRKTAGDISTDVHRDIVHGRPSAGADHEIKRSKDGLGLVRVKGMCLHPHVDKSLHLSHLYGLAEGHLGIIRSSF